MNAIAAFKQECRERISAVQDNEKLVSASRNFMLETIKAGYSYNFEWLGRPIIQYPQDIVAVQEIVWQVKPDLIIETGIAHGGSLIFSASMLAMLDYCDAAEKGEVVDPKKPRRRVLGVDIDIRAHNKAAIEAHPMASRIDMIQGSSVDPAILKRVKETAAQYERVLVCLDSNHTHDHVYAELEAYAPLTTKGSYCIVFDTVVEELPEGLYASRPWDRGNNPMTAVRKYMDVLAKEGRKAADGGALKFDTDRMVQDKLLVTVAPEGYLRRV